VDTGDKWRLLPFTPLLLPLKKALEKSANKIKQEI
jgi:hypothetical protein